MGLLVHNSYIPNLSLYLSLAQGKNPFNTIFNLLLAILLPQLQVKLLAISSICAIISIIDLLLLH
jgi:hypothetical protein